MAILRLAQIEPGLSYLYLATLWPAAYVFVTMLQHGTTFDSDTRAPQSGALPRVASAHIRLILLAIAISAVLAGLAVVAYHLRQNVKAAVSSTASPATVAPPVVLPQSDPEALRPLTREQAVEWNDAIPIATMPNPAASPFKPGIMTAADATRSLDCMTAAIYYEAASESDEGQRAVAQVVLNRVRHPAFPHTVCGVVFQGYERPTGCQFSFTCDGALARHISQKAWARARSIASKALAGSVFAPVGWATHYHTDWVAPYWSTTLVKTVQVGAHIFYRWQGRWGTSPAFTARYAAVEPTLALPFGTPGEVLPTLTGTLPVGEIVTVTDSERPILPGDRVLAKASFSTGAPVAAPARSVASSERPIFGASGATAAPLAAAPPPASK